MCLTVSLCEETLKEHGMGHPQWHLNARWHRSTYHTFSKLNRRWDWVCVWERACVCVWERESEIVRDCVGGYERKTSGDWAWLRSNQKGGKKVVFQEDEPRIPCSHWKDINRKFADKAGSYGKKTLIDWLVPNVTAYFFRRKFDFARV